VICCCSGETAPTTVIENLPTEQGQLAAHCWPLPRIAAVGKGLTA